MRVDSIWPSGADLESLLVNNPDLDRISYYLRRFNPIRVMRMEGMEIRHSAILAWLLDPGETHSLGDKFLRSFLAEALKGDFQSLPNALDILQADLYGAEIHREKSGIDIYILIPSRGWAFIIENKFRSTQSDRQLSRYMKVAEKRANEWGKKLIHRGIFLALNDEEPEEPSFVRIQYKEVFGILEQLLTHNGVTISSDVYIFIRHYLDVVGESTGMSNELREMELLAKSLYQRYRRELDFIVDHGRTTSFMVAVDSVFGVDLKRGDKKGNESVGIIFNSLNDFQMSFLPAIFFNAFGGEDARGKWIGCEKWWSGYPISCWFQLNRNSNSVKGQVSLYAEVGPWGEAGRRSELINSIRNVNSELVRFRADADRSDAKYSKFLKNNSISISDVNDSEAIASAIRDLMSRFGSVFQDIGRSLETIF